MFNTDLKLYRYSLAASGLKLKAREYQTRRCAEQAMYELCGKHGIRIQEQYHDNHDRTYICDNGARFYIQRV